MSMSFYDAKNEVLQTSRYDTLMGRRLDITSLISDVVSDALRRLFSLINIDINIGSAEYDLDILYTLFILVGIVLIIVAAIVLFRTLHNTRRVDYYDFSDIFEELTQKKYSIAELIHLSDNSETRRFAIRYRYIAVLLSLTENYIIEIKPSATNAVILSQIKQVSPSLLLDFENTADIFHKVWFGYKEIYDSAYEHFKDSVNFILLSGDKNE